MVELTDHERRVERALGTPRRTLAEKREAAEIGVAHAELIASWAEFPLGTAA